MWCGPAAMWLLANADEMTWSSDAAEGEEAEVRTEEGAVTAALTRAFRAVDEEVTGSVMLQPQHTCLQSCCVLKA